MRQQINAFNDQTLLRHPHARAVAAYVQDVIRVHVRLDVMMGVAVRTTSREIHT